MDRGFTLMELMIALAVVAIVSVAVAPAMARWAEQDEMDLATRDLRALLRDARMAAVEQGRPVSVILEPESGRYWVSVGRESEGVRVIRGTMPIQPGVRLSAADRRLQFRFDPHGPAYGDSVLVRVANRSALVHVDPWTGDVRARR